MKRYKWALLTAPVLALGLGLAGCEVEEPGDVDVTPPRVEGGNVDIDLPETTREGDIDVTPPKVDMTIPDVDADLDVRDEPDADTAAGSGLEGEATDMDTDLDTPDLDADATDAEPVEPVEPLQTEPVDDVDEVETEINEDGTTETEIDR